MNTKWTDFVKTGKNHVLDENSTDPANRPALIDTEALRGIPHLVWSGEGNNRMLQLVGDKRPDTRNALLLSENQAIELYFDIIRRLHRKA